MSDITERLRSAPMRLSNIGENAEKLLLEAADEIDRLNAALRNAADDMRNGVSRVELAIEH